MSTEGNKQVSNDDRTEQLRVILEQQQGRAVTQEEALEIGESLMTFFETLGEEIPQEVEQLEKCLLGVNHG